MENKNKELIRRLLSDQLDDKDKQSLSQLDFIEKRLKKQWDNPSAEKHLDHRKGKDIWQKIIKKQGRETKRLVHLELWHLIAASVVLLFVVGQFWLFSDSTRMDEYVEVLADKSMIYTLPDSSKVWMEAGSSIRFSEEFDKERVVWLTGNSLFEVRNQQGSRFRVYLDKSFVEVKGTCFLIKQKSVKSEVTLFNGSVSFNIEPTGEQIDLKAAQRIVYNSSNAQAKVENMEMIDWKNGRFNFSNIHLKQLIRTINQIYGMDIRVEEGVGRTAAFTGNIRFDEPLNDVVDKICFTLNLKQKEESGNIVIYK